MWFVIQAQKPIYYVNSRPGEALGFIIGCVVLALHWS